MKKTISKFIFTLLVSTLGVTAQSGTAMASLGASPILAKLAATPLGGQININSASQKQWEMLPGIGPATAKKLVAYSTKKPFGDVTHVMRIKGIGRKTFSTIKPYLSLKGETTLQRHK